MPEKPKYPLLEALHGKPNKNQEVLVECESEQRRLVRKSYYLMTAKINSPKHLFNYRNFIASKIRILKIYF